MKKNFRKTLLAAAIAAVISAPAWSANDMTGPSPDKERTLSAQSEGDRGISVDRRSVDGAVRARASGNLLYTRTPGELSGMAVIGSGGESIGKIKGVVMDRSRDDVHAVIASGGVLGIGSRETLLPLAELTLLDDDKVQARLTKKAISELPEFQKEHYGVLEANRRISDFSAFEPTMSASDQASARAAAEKQESAKAAERATARAAEAMQSEMSVAPLILRTPKELEGMEVVGPNCQNIGKVNAIVSSNSHDQIHAVISSGGFLGIGAREIAVPLDDLNVVGDDQLQAGFNQDAVEAHPEYKSDEYGTLDSDRPISESLALQPVSNR